jgi:tetratricopeptide (TPR) repeat protein
MPEQIALAAFTAWTAGALLCGAALVWIWHCGDASRPDRKPLAAASALACAGCAFGAALGPDHPGVALTLNNLGLLYLTQGKYAQSQSALERALAIRQADQIRRRIDGWGADFAYISADAKAQGGENRGAKKKKSEGRQVVFSIHWIVL